MLLSPVAAAFRLRIAVFLPAVLLVLGARAEKRTLDGIFPAGAAAGTTNTITLFGKFDPWPPQIWSSGPGLAFAFETNKGKVAVTVDAKAEPGPRLVRVFNAEGASEARFFMVGSAPESAEQEPNDHFRSPQSLARETLVNGRLERNGDVDSYAISLKAGEWLDARLDSYVLMSKLDPVLRLLDTNGFQIAWNHDFDCLDPRLVWRSPREQTVILQVFGFVYPANAEIQLSGGSGGAYRLRLARGSSDPLAEECSAKGLALGGAVCGAVCPAGEKDRYKVSLKKGQWVEARAAAAAIGSPLDPWLAIEDSTGKELSRNDDAEGTRDPRLEWQAPADGEFAFVVGSVTSQGREEFRYRLTLQALAPDFSVTVPEQAFVLKPGETNVLKLNLNRQRGFTNEVELVFRGLPESVAGESRKDAKGGELSLNLVAATNAPAWNGPFAIAAKDLATGAEKLARFELTSRTENNGVPGGYSKLAIDSFDALWLTVLAHRSQ